MVALLAMTACASGTQRAAVSAAPPASTAQVLDVTPAVTDYTVDTRRSRFEVWAIDITGSEHMIRFKEWQARVRTAPVPTISAEIQMCTATTVPPRGTRLLRSSFLECDKFPTSTLEATMRKMGEKPHEHVVEGISELHGVRKQLRFKGVLTPEGDGFRLTAQFVISRKTFKIRYGPMEPFLKDDVRIVIDALAFPATAPPAPLPVAPPEPEEPDE
jgi:polyisoprenoid-binding protein YceI